MSWIPQKGKVQSLRDPPKAGTDELFEARMSELLNSKILKSWTGELLKFSAWGKRKNVRSLPHRPKAKTSDVVSIPQNLEIIRRLKQGTAESLNCSKEEIQERKLPNPSQKHVHDRSAQVTLCTRTSDLD